MRGAFVDQGRLFSYISPEARVPASHPLRRVRELVRDVLGELNRTASPHNSLSGYFNSNEPDDSVDKVVGQHVM